MSPFRSPIAARTTDLPTSIPTTQPARGFSSYRTALGPLPPDDRPAGRTSRPRSSATRAWDTVGLDSPLSLAIWARETGPTCRMNSRTARSLMALSRLGVPAAKVWSAPVRAPYSSAKETFLTIWADATLPRRSRSREALSEGAAMDEFPRFDLTGQVALVTGAARGLGRAISLALANAGADVALGFRDANAGGDVASQVESMGRRALPVQLDVTRLDQVFRAVDDTTRGLGRIDILVNNAGLGPENPAEDVREEDFDLTVAVNVKGTFFASQAAGRHGITVNAVAPTFISTPGTESALADPEFRADVLERIAGLHRVGVPMDVAGAVVFLASPAASLITGETILIDGGWTAR